MLMRSSATLMRPKLIEKRYKRCYRLGDWEDFWYSPENNTWGSDALDEVWETMDKIEPLTPPNGYK